MNSTNTLRTAKWHWALFATCSLLVASPAHADSPPSTFSNAENDGGAFQVHDGEQLLALKVGEKRILITDEDIPRVLNTNPKKLRVTPLAPRKIQATGHSEGMLELKLWDKSGKVRTVDVVVGDPKQAKFAKTKLDFVGKWVVRNIVRDGYKHPAQLGREVGDVITMKLGPDKLLLIG